MSADDTRILIAMDTPDCITFDLDDTLWDHRRAQAQALEEVAAKVVAASRVADFVDRFHHHNGRLWEEYRAGTVSAKDVKQQRFVRTLDDLGADPGRAAELVPWFLDRYSRLPYLRDGAAETLRELASRTRLGCVTDGFTAIQRIKLETTGIAGCFDFLLTSDEVGAAKPSAMVYEAAARAAGCPPDRAVHVGDSYEKDVVGAARQGFRTVWIPHPEHSRPVLGADDPRPDWEVDELRQLGELLGTSEDGHRAGA